MRNLFIISLLVVLQFIGLPVQAQSSILKSWRFWKAPDYTRLVFDVSEQPDYHVMELKNPDRLVIDFHKTQLTKPLNSPPANDSLFAALRTSARNKHDLRVVIELQQAAVSNSFTLKPNKNKGHRLVIDLTKIRSAKVKTTVKKTKAVKRSTQLGNSFIVAIDAGHGGEDPGAHGPRGTEEKTVVLQIAKKLKAFVDKKSGMRAILIRKGDYYVDLRERMEIARKGRADLFISIHADAFKNAKVKGASVYTISHRGASSEAARWLADRENAADLVGGVTLDDKDGMLASVLLDLSQTATKDHSRELANHVLKNIGRIGKLHKNTVQKAGFLVLKSPDIPSILVETAYISNPTEEHRLRNSQYQNKLAKSIYNGIVEYYQHHLPVGVRVAATQHTISRGDTLSGIALQYGVSMKKLQTVNKLPSRQVRVGQVLSIPRT